MAVAYRSLHPVAAAFAWEGPSRCHMVYLGVLVGTLAVWSCGCCCEDQDMRGRKPVEAPALPPTLAGDSLSSFPVPLLAAHVSAEAKLGEKRRHAQGSRSAAASPYKLRSAAQAYGNMSSRFETL